MKRIDDEKILTAINNKVISMLSRIEFVKIQYTPRYTINSDKYLYENDNSFYEIMNLDHGITKREYMGKNVTEVTNKIIKDCIIYYAIGVYEPESQKFLPSYKVGSTNWNLINDFIAKCYKYIFPDETPPIFPYSQ